MKREVRADAAVDKGKGKQRADESGQQLTAEALAALGRPVDVKGKGKQRDLEQEMIAMSKTRVENWNVDAGKSGEATAPNKSKSDEGVFLVVYDLDAIAAHGGSDPERGKMAEFGLKGTPSAMTCRGTSRGVVVVLVRAVPAAVGAGSG